MLAGCVLCGGGAGGGGETEGRRPGQGDCAGGIRVERNDKWKRLHRLYLAVCEYLLLCISLILFIVK